MAEDKDIEELKKLSPAERIKKLKDLQEKRKQEIEQAQKLITESEEQEEREKELEKIPIPQIKAVNIDALFSSEEKELFKEKRFVEEGRTEEPKEALAKEKLEEIAEQAPKALPEERLAQEQRVHQQYVNQLSQRPAGQLKERVTEIYKNVKESGYISDAQEGELKNIEYANRKKMNDIEEGKYSGVNKEIAESMIVTEKMKNWLENQYKA